MDADPERALPLSGVIAELEQAFHDDVAAGAANRLLDLRVAGGLSREQLAREVSRDVATIAGWEVGVEAIPHGDAAAIATVFGVSVGHLLREPSEAA